MSKNQGTNIRKKYVQANIDIGELADLRAQLAEALARAEKAEAGLKAGLGAYDYKQYAANDVLKAQLAEAEKVIDAAEPFSLAGRCWNEVRAYRAKYPRREP